MSHRWWYLAGFVGFAGYIPALPAGLRLLNLCFLVPFALEIFNGVRNRRAAPARPEPMSPSARPLWMVPLRIGLSSVLMLVVPSMLRQSIRQMKGDGLARQRAIDEPISYQQRTRYRLPFDGTWYIINGGPDAQTSHSWDIIAQRYAYDFVISDDALQRWRTDGKQSEDYLCYSAPILAPADGVITSVVDGVRDAPAPGTGWLDVFTRHFPGNAVTIRHAEGEYSFLAHLIPGSITVRMGDSVAAGQIIGCCGNSGHSTEPHLHFQVQDRADFFEAAGLPVQFDGVVVAPSDQSSAMNGIYLVRGTHVKHAV